MCSTGCAPLRRHPLPSLERSWRLPSSSTRTTTARPAPSNSRRTRSLRRMIDPFGAHAHTVLARVIYDDFRAAADHAREALRLTEELEEQDRGTLSQALVSSAAASFMAGRGLDVAMFDRAIDLERETSVSAADSAYGTLAALLKYADDLARSRTMLESLLTTADDGSLPYVVGHLPQLELWSGNWDEAERLAHHQLELAERAEQHSHRQAAMFNLATIAAHRGDVDRALPLATELHAEGQASGALWTERIGAGLLGFLYLSIDAADDAVRHLKRYDQISEQIGLREPGYIRYYGDMVEAYVAVGNIDEANRLLARIEPRALRLGRMSALGSVQRGRAIVLAHDGHRESAIAAARSSVRAYDGTELVYDRSRAVLTLGVVLRRFKRRAEAREVLTEAMSSFESMGAKSFVERTRRELDRLGGRAAAPSALTQTEARVASLAASGRSTCQMADALFISPKTVEANLTRIYRKLGVTNRAELASHLADHTPT